LQAICDRRPESVYRPTADRRSQTGGKRSKSIRSQAVCDRRPESMRRPTDDRRSQTGGKLLIQPLAGGLRPPSWRRALPDRRPPVADRRRTIELIVRRRSVIAVLKACIARPPTAGRRPAENYRTDRSHAVCDRRPESVRRPTDDRRSQTGGKLLIQPLAGGLRPPSAVTAVLKACVTRPMAAGHPGPRGVANLSWPTGQGAGRPAGSYSSICSQAVCDRRPEGVRRPTVDRRSQTGGERSNW